MRTDEAYTDRAGLQCTHVEYTVAILVNKHAGIVYTIFSHRSLQVASDNIFIFGKNIIHGRSTVSYSLMPRLRLKDILLMEEYGAKFATRSRYIIYLYRGMACIYSRASIQCL